MESGFLGRKQSSCSFKKIFSTHAWLSRSSYVVDFVCVADATEVVNAVLDIGCRCCHLGRLNHMQSAFFSDVTQCNGALKGGLTL